MRWCGNCCREGPAAGEFYGGSLRTNLVEARDIYTSPLRRQGPKFEAQSLRVPTWAPAFAGATVLGATPWFAAIVVPALARYP